MQRAVQSELASRVIRHIDDGTTDVTGEMAAVQTSEYRDEGVLRRELTGVLLSTPTIVAHVSQLRSVGDYLATDLYGVPFVLVRQPSMEIRGFVNLCGHRGAQVVGPGAATAVGAGFTCPWHGWRYSLAGELCHIPDQARGFPDLELAGRGLRQVRTEVRHGFVWLSWAPGRVDSVAEHLGPLDAELAGYDLQDYSCHGTEARPGHFNWKLGIEAFLETYHFRWLHPAMKKYVFAPDLSLVDALGSHVRLIAPKKSALENRDLPVDERRIREHATLAYGLFPNTMVFVEKRHVSVMSMYPSAPDHCDVRFLHIVSDTSAERRPYFDDNIGKFMTAVDEDFAVLQTAQAGFSGLAGSGSDGAWPAGHRTVIFGRNEKGCQLFRSNLRSALAE